MNQKLKQKQFRKDQQEKERKKIFLKEQGWECKECGSWNRTMINCRCDMTPGLFPIGRFNLTNIKIDNLNER